MSEYPELTKRVDPHHSQRALAAKIGRPLKRPTPKPISDHVVYCPDCEKREVSPGHKYCLQCLSRRRRQTKAKYQRKYRRQQKKGGEDRA